MEDAMCHHLNAFGQFQCDHYPDRLPDEIVLSYQDPAAMEALHAFAELTDDDGLAVGIVKRLEAIADEYMKSNEATEQIINKQIDRKSAEALVYSK
jgi:guanylate kinase